MPRKKLPRHTDAQLHAKASEIWSLISYLYIEADKREIYTAHLDEFVPCCTDGYTAVEKNKIKKYVRELIKECGYALITSPLNVERESYLDSLAITTTKWTAEDYSKTDFIKQEQRAMAANYPRIDDETAKDLLAKHHQAVKDGKRKLANIYRDQIACPFFYLVIIALKKMHLLADINNGQDMVHKAFVEALYGAIEKYDPKKANNCKVVTYLTTQLFCFAKLLVTVPYDAAIKVPTYIYAEIKRINKFVREYEVQNGKEPTDDEIKSVMGYKAGIWTNIQQVRYHAILSLDMVYDENTTLSEVVPDDFDLEENFENNEFVSTIHEILRNCDIPMRTRMMVLFKFGFIDGKGHTNQETGIWIAKYNNGKQLTAESVRKNIQPALAILADHPELKKLNKLV